jgi:hypothetical protein
VRFDWDSRQRKAVPVITCFELTFKISRPDPVGAGRLDHGRVRVSAHAPTPILVQGVMAVEDRTDRAAARPGQARIAPGQHANELLRGPPILPSRRHQQRLDDGLRPEWKRVGRTAPLVEPVLASRSHRATGLYPVERLIRYRSHSSLIDQWPLAKSHTK